MANNRYANAARRKRQEKTRKPKRNSSAGPRASPEPLAELIDNLNWLIGSIRKATESESARVILDRFVRLALSACIPHGVTFDSNGWAALLNLANGRSFSAMKNRRRIASHKPGQTLMYSAADLLEATSRSRGETTENSA